MVLQVSFCLFLGWVWVWTYNDSGVAMLVALWYVFIYLAVMFGPDV